MVEKHMMSITMNDVVAEYTYLNDVVRYVYSSSSIISV